MIDKKGIPLSNVIGFPQISLDKLASVWITTAEELVSAAVRENGPTGLAEILEMPVEQVVQLVDLAQSSLPLGVSFAAGEVQSFGLGALDEPGAEEPPSSHSLSFAPLPSRVDYIDRMPPIRNQGQRGTCVSFACSAIREYLLPAMSNQKDLSEQHLYWNSKKHDMVSGAGTYIHVSMDRLLKDGQCTETDWPYNSIPIPGNEGQDPPPVDAAAKALPYRISSTQKLPARSVDDLRQALANGSPIAFAIPVYTYWFAEPLYSSGDIRLPLASDQLAGGHAMAMVGYEDDPQVPGGGYFMIRNSWGTGWAHQCVLGSGYARLPYSYIQQYGSAAHTALASAPTPVEEPQENFFTRFWNWLKKLFG